MLWANFGPKQTLTRALSIAPSAVYVSHKKLIPAARAHRIILSPIRQGHHARRRVALGWGSLTRSRHARDADKAEGHVRTG